MPTFNFAYSQIHANLKLMSTVPIAEPALNLLNERLAEATTKDSVLQNQGPSTCTSLYDLIKQHGRFETAVLCAAVETFACQFLVREHGAIGACERTLPLLGARVHDMFQSVYDYLLDKAHATVQRAVLTLNQLPHEKVALSVERISGALGADGSLPARFWNDFILLGALHCKHLIERIVAQSKLALGKLQSRCGSALDILRATAIVSFLRRQIFQVAFVFICGCSVITAFFFVYVRYDALGKEKHGPGQGFANVSGADLVNISEEEEVKDASAGPNNDIKKFIEDTDAIDHDSFFTSASFGNTDAVNLSSLTDYFRFVGLDRQSYIDSENEDDNFSASRIYGRKRRNSIASTEEYLGEGEVGLFNNSYASSLSEVKILRDDDAMSADGGPPSELPSDASFISEMQDPEVVINTIYNTMSGPQASEEQVNIKIEPPSLYLSLADFKINRKLKPEDTQSSSTKTSLITPVLIIKARMKYRNPVYGTWLSPGYRRSRAAKRKTSPRRKAVRQRVL